ncbi:uncharacterized protein LOC134283217 [Saccostrea cucullata]|uniref:uncharacterized protein LOC134283217 n=1 Tax=Saccostrea cuccullata TaxID=36930 RepID=UPI002ED172A8
MIKVTQKKTVDRKDDGTLKISTTLGVDPFDHVTIASVCMAIYKTLFLEEEIEIEIKMSDSTNPISKWYKVFTDGNQSKFIEIGDSKFSLDVISKDPNFQVGQTRFLKSPIAAVPSTGYVARDNYSCVFHGCPSCYPDDRSTLKHSSTGQSMEELYTITKKREKELRALGYIIVSIWEHDFLKQLKTNKVLKEYVANLDIQDRLNPRESFFGGRTNAIKLHYKAKDDEKIHYYDFTSLYPWTNKYSKYPIGHPEILTDDFKDLSQYFGLAKVKVLPPKGLYHPVLPYNSNGKLKFPLCKKCADEENQDTCTCSIDERCIIGTWCTPELELAISKGYEVLKIYEIYHFKDATQYDRFSGQGGLFSPYVNMFLKIKQESSGFPSGCISLEDKLEYIRQYEENEGIQLEYHNVKKNPGLRCLAKLCLNSFWGKFGQRLLMRQSEFIHESEAEKFFKLLSDVRKNVNNFHIISNDTVQLEWIEDPLFPGVDNKTNIFLASFTTMWARLKLYSVLDILGEDVLYFDTDSIIFKSKISDDLRRLPIGNYLGELTNEIKPQDGFITEFVSGGPKNYAYRTLSGREECKVRGFTLNWKNSKLINFDAIKSMICTGQNDSVTITNPCKISRDSRKRKLFNRIEEKKYQMVYTKRKILSNLDTLPYGY